MTTYTTRLLLVLLAFVLTSCSAEKPTSTQSSDRAKSPGKKTAETKSAIVAVLGREDRIPTRGTRVGGRRESLDDRYRRINVAAMKKDPPSKRRIKQRAFASPDKALDAYVEALFVADEPRFAACAGERVWNLFYTNVKSRKNNWLKYIDDQPWRTELATLFSRHWAPAKSKRFPVETQGNGQATVLSTCEYVLGGTKYKRYVEIAFRKNADGWVISDRRVSDTAGLSAERLKAKPVNSTDAELLASLKKRGIGGTSPRLYGGGGANLEFDRFNDGRVKPEVLTIVKRLKFISGVTISSGLSDAGFDELLPIIKTAHVLELNCGSLSQMSIEKISELKYLSRLILSGRENETILGLPLGRLRYLYHLEVSGFPKLTTNALATWNGLKQLRELTVSSVHGLNDGPFAFLNGCHQLRDLELEDIKGLTDKLTSHFQMLSSLSRLRLSDLDELGDPAFAKLATLSQLKKVELYRLKSFRGGGLGSLTLPEYVNIDLRELTLDGEQLKCLGDIQVSHIELHNLTITGPGLGHFGLIKTAYSVTIDSCKFELKSLAALADLRFRRGGEFIAIYDSVTADDVQHVQQVKHPLSLSFSGTVTDETLRMLHALKNLKHLILSDDDKVTKAGIDKLKQAIPGLSVSRF